MQIFLTFVTRGFRHEPCRCLEDSGCEDLPAGPQMQEMAIIATGGYASEPATCCLSKTSIIISGMTSFWIWYAQCDLSDILALHEFCHLDHLFHFLMPLRFLHNPQFFSGFLRPTEGCLLRQSSNWLAVVETAIWWTSKTFRAKDRTLGVYSWYQLMIVDVWGDLTCQGLGCWLLAKVLWRSEYVCPSDVPLVFVDW